MGNGKMVETMTEHMPGQGIPHRKDTSNFHYAGMYLTLIATLLFLFEFLIILGLALDIIDQTGEWVWEVVWEVILAFIILIGGFVSVALAYKRRGYPTVITIMTLMLAVSLLNIFKLEWPTLTMMTFVVCLIALIKLSIGHGEFITPRQKREGKAMALERTDEPQTRQAQPVYREEIYEQERPRVVQQPVRTQNTEQPARKQAPARTQQPVPAANVQRAAQRPAQTRQAAQTQRPAQPRARPKPQQSKTGSMSVKVRTCGRCAEMIPRDEPVCLFCGDDSYRKELIKKIEVAYDSGVISREQYLHNLERFKN